VLRTGDPVADSLTDLANDGPIEGIRVDAFGAPIPGHSMVAELRWQAAEAQ
jgi:hypothetical protein